jgi:hypothetical protein
MRNFHESFNNFFDVFIDINDLGDYSIDDFYGWWSIDNLRLFFIFIDLWNLLDNRNKFFNKIRNLFELVDNSPDFNNLFLVTINNLNLFFYINLRNFLKSILLLHNNFLLDLIDNLRLILHYGLFNNLLNDVRDRFNMYCLGIDVNWHGFFKSNRNRNFNWLDDNFIDIMNNVLLDWHADNFIDVQSYRHFLSVNPHSFFNYLFHLNICTCL